MKDRELLEYAAKAAGYTVDEYDNTQGAWVYPKGAMQGSNGKYQIFKWNPRNDDGEALRLATRLGMKLAINLHHRFVTCNDVQVPYDEAKFGGVCDADSATRLAILQAAAEIGKEML